MASENYYVSSPDWVAYQKSHNLAENDPTSFDLTGLRDTIDAVNLKDCDPTDFGYEIHFETIKSNNADVELKIYRPSNSSFPKKPLPLLFLTHGGGWISSGHALEEQFLLRPIWQNFDFLMVSVDYRLAPEHPFPNGLQDCWNALAWVTAKADRLQNDPERILLAGSSAGANLAAALSQMARDNRGPKISGVILNVPALCDPRHFPIEYKCSAYEQAGANGSMLRIMWELYVSSPTKGAEPLVSPLLGHLEGLPPHLVFLSGQGAERDDGIAYVDRLEKAGVGVKSWIYPGVPHHFTSLKGLESRERWCENLIEGMKELLARTTR